MNNHSESGTKPESPACQLWGLKRAITPGFGARLVQDGLIPRELNPRYQHCVTLYHPGLTCDADTLGSCGYVYIAIYPEQTEPH